MLARIKRFRYIGAAVALLSLVTIPVVSQVANETVASAQTTDHCRPHGDIWPGNEDENQPGNDTIHWEASFICDQGYRMGETHMWAHLFQCRPNLTRNGYVCPQPGSDKYTFEDYLNDGSEDCFGYTLGLTSCISNTQGHGAMQDESDGGRCWVLRVGGWYTGFQNGEIHTVDPIDHGPERFV